MGIPSAPAPCVLRLITALHGAARLGSYRPQQHSRLLLFVLDARQILHFFLRPGLCVLVPTTVSARPKEEILFAPGRQFAGCPGSLLAAPSLVRGQGQCHCNCHCDRDRDRHLHFHPAQGLGFRRNPKGGPAARSPMLPDLAHKISLQWSSVWAINQACPGSFETAELAMSTWRDFGCIIVRSHPSIAAPKPSRSGPSIGMGRGQLPRSAPLLAYPCSTTTQIVIYYRNALMPWSEKHRARLSPGSGRPAHKFPKLKFAG